MSLPSKENARLCASIVKEIADMPASRGERDVLSGELRNMNPGAIDLSTEPDDERGHHNSNSQNGAVAAISAAHLLHPAKHFGHPRDVLAADDIGNDEKRAIFASWASDIFAIESIPALRLSRHG